MERSIKAKDTIRRNLKELRTECIDASDADHALRRIAYGMECAVRWATEKTVGWPSLRQEALLLAACLRKELDTK